ncbi:MAG: adenylate/guanylate cyclase domain-containing protein [Treponemataceae bacterium]|nr:MAG: adenylate/guanylate cyclase domain-containing protein [Treponemataceae bacterium]
MPDTRKQNFKRNFFNGKLFSAAVIVVISFVLCVALLQSGVLEPIELKSYDLRMQHTSSRGNIFSAAQKLHSASETIAVVLVNQASIDWAQAERGWGWPWPRSAYADLVRYFDMAGAASVAFDIIFSEPSARAEDDENFAAASRDFERVVQTLYFDASADRTVRPTILLEQSAALLGNINGFADKDGVVRRARFLYSNKRAGIVDAPSLGMAGLFAAGDNPDFSGYEQAPLLRFPLSIDEYVPYDMKTILLSYEAALQKRTFTSGLLDPANFKDMHVFVGYYAPGLFDICTTPVSSTYPGMGVHIAQLSNYLTGGFIKAAPRGISLVIVFLCAVLGIVPVALGDKFIGKRYAAGVYAGVFILLAALYAIVCWGAFAANFYIPLAAPFLSIVFSFLAYSVRNNIVEGSQRRFLKTAFKQYLSPVYIDQLISNPDQLRLGGERREISIFFSDVQGFTTISEKLDPDQLKELLNDYLTLLTDIIQNSGGTIDKYEGDAIIAFWNAPLNLGDHAARALEAALECQNQLALKNEYFEDKFKNWGVNAPGLNKRMLTRIGLNTGYAVVGNFGSATHFNYTMLGDSVNLAARLEGLNKQFGTFLMCTDMTFTEAKRAKPFYGRKLAQVAVVGKTEPVTVWEPLTKAVFERSTEIIKRFSFARDTFYAGDFAKALELFDALKDKDKPAGFYAEQCRYYMEKPELWKGYWQALSK